MPRIAGLAALTVALSANLASAQWSEWLVQPKADKPLDITAPIKIVYTAVLKGDAETYPIAGITARLDWGGTYAEKYGGPMYEVVSNLSSTEDGEFTWDPREIRSVIEANGTYPELQFMYMVQTEDFATPTGGSASGVGSDVFQTSGQNNQTSGPAPSGDGHVPSGSNVARASLGVLATGVVAAMLSLM
ncbi:hypothetical protein F5X68DRAFT_265791 [Plectosphaerella plurivora]|uniref:Uncharacterized protein n=1 Tax=Plectosphaerella plurivora TaxID=936078 RepID=A0A9P9A5B6_9PEZI|nr:hypothetical protein F5X68DRAFT_265791 [Plectosphaerella plurivora]